MILNGLGFVSAPLYLFQEFFDQVLVESKIPGYPIGSCCCDYGQVRQRWLIIGTNVLEEMY